MRWRLLGRREDEAIIMMSRAVAGRTLAARITTAVCLSVAGSLAIAESFPSAECARADLAERLQVPLDKVVIVEQIEKTWPDSSIGCPQPGMVYRQVLVNGSHMVLEVAGRRYNYHAASSRVYFYCAATKTKKGPNRSLEPLCKSKCKIYSSSVLTSSPVD